MWMQVAKVLTLNEECLIHWAEHFKCQLNHSPPSVNVTEADNQDVHCNELSRLEVLSPPIMAAEESPRNPSGLGMLWVSVPLKLAN